MIYWYSYWICVTIKSLIPRHFKNKCQTNYVPFYGGVPYSGILSTKRGYTKLWKYYISSKVNIEETRKSRVLQRQVIKGKFSAVGSSLASCVGKNLILPYQPFVKSRLLYASHFTAPYFYHNCSTAKCVYHKSTTFYQPS